MEPAIFINQRAARKFMGSIPPRDRAPIMMHPVYQRNALKGYTVQWRGTTVTENDVESMERAHV